MCDQDTMIVIQETVQEFVTDDKQFTAFDVTLAVKEKCKEQGQSEPRHRNIKNDIHREMEPFCQQGLYEKSLQDVGAPSQAFVYFPDGEDPKNYEPLKRNDGPASKPQSTTATATAPAPAAAAAAAGDGDDDESDTSGRRADARGTLCVPNFILSAAGFQPKDTAYCYVDERAVLGQKEQVLAICKSAPSKQIVATYTVDYSGNVRVTSAVLKAAGFNDGTFDFERNDDTVVVSLHGV